MGFIRAKCKPSWVARTKRVSAESQLPLRLRWWPLGWVSSVTMMCCVQICSRAAINNSLSRVAQRRPRSSFISRPDRELLTLSADILTTGSCGCQPRAVGPVGLPKQGSGAEATAPLAERLWSSRYLLLSPWAPLSAWIPPAGSPLLCLGLSCRDPVEQSCFSISSWGL